MVQRESDAADARAKRICFTAAGLAWVQAYQDAVQHAQAELEQSVGPEVATVIASGSGSLCQPLSRMLRKPPPGQPHEDA